MKVGDLFIDEGEIVESFVRASGPRRAERQQGGERGRVALRRAPLAEPAQRRRDQADQARRRARDAGRRDRHLRPALLQPAAQPRGRARTPRRADRSRRSSAKNRAARPSRAGPPRPNASTRRAGAARSRRSEARPGRIERRACSAWVRREKDQFDRPCGAADAERGRDGDRQTRRAAGGGETVEDGLLAGTVGENDDAAASFGIARCGSASTRTRG